MRTGDARPTSLPIAGDQELPPRISELVVISGKGGTGKTSVVASFGVLGDNVVIADCDVDAADLHLVLSPVIGEIHGFISGHEAVIRQDDCCGTGVCREVCRFDAVGKHDHTGRFVIDPLACEGCGVCVELCPNRAIDFVERTCGAWYVSSTPSGPMVHARLSIAAENSGKLVATVRREATRVAVANRCTTVLVDGPPGIGCPVIASITGASGVLIVTEPTVSGAHDMERVLALARHFDVPAAVCVNRWDLNPDGADRIESRATDLGAAITGRIRYDPTVTRAQVEGRTVVELGGEAADDVRVVWDQVRRWLKC
jgi:MinD superfamily P-loop ATPase